MGFFSKIAEFASHHSKKHFGNHIEGIKSSNRMMKQATDTAEKERLLQIRNEHRNNLLKSTFYTGGTAAALGGAYYGGKALRGTGRVAKNVGQTAMNSFSGYDLFIPMMFLMYFIFSPIYRISLEFTIAVHVAIIFVLRVFVLRDSDRNWETYTIMAFIIVIEVFLPTFIYQVEFLMNNTWIVNYLVNPQFTCLWLYFGILKSPKNTIITKYSYIGVIFLWFGIAFSFAMTTFSYEDANLMVSQGQIQAAENLYSKTGEWWLDVATNINQVMKQGRQYFINRMNMATGDYYTGTVDENQHQRLGVYLEDLKASDPEFYQGETVSVWAMLEAKTLEDGLKIDINCYHGKKNSDGIYPDSQRGQSYPPIIPLVYDEEQVDIDCKFSGSMEQGSNKVTVQAEFHFETMAYLKVYFMDKDTLRSMDRQGIDPYEQYGIEDKKPIAKFTNGPVKIGMGPNLDAPIGINDAYSVNPRLGITLDTNLGWKGQIKQIDELMVMVPNTMSLDTTVCPEFKEIDNEVYKNKCVDNYKKYRSKQLFECVQNESVDLDKETNLDPEGNLTFATSDQKQKFKDCLNYYCAQELGEYNAYELIINKDTEKFYTNIGVDNPEKQHKTFSCRVNLDEPANILGNSPFAIHYFKTKARYTYVIEESTNVLIKEVEGDESTVPKSKYTDEKNIPFIFNQWNEKISDICTEEYVNNNPLIKDKNECICFISAIINVESTGNEKARSGKGAMGLMQVMPTTATWLNEKFKLFDRTYDLYNADDNMLFGTTYLQYLSNLDIVERNLDYVMAAYNGGTCGYKESKGYYDGALCTEKENPTFSCSGQGIKFYQCEKLSGYLETRNYVVEVNKNMDACMNMELVDYGTIENETNTKDFLIQKPGKVTYDEIIKFDNNFELKFEEKVNYYEYHSDEESGYTIELYYKGIEIDKLDIESVFINQIYFFDDYPFILLKFTDKESFEISYWKESIINSDNLFENERIDSAQGGTEKKLTPIWISEDKPLIYAHYTGGSIEMYDKNEKRFCTIPWERDAVYRFCDGDEIINFYVKNIVTTTTEINGKEPYVKAQFIYRPGLEDTCCDKCSSCLQIECSTCNNCQIGNKMEYGIQLCYEKTQE